VDQRPRAGRAAGIRQWQGHAAQVGESPVDHSGLGNEGDDEHLVCPAGTPQRVDLRTCISGDAGDLARLDDLVLEMFPEDKLTVKWINLARKNLPIEALPARVCYLGFGERKAFVLAVSDLIEKGEIKGPVAFSRDNLDSGSIVNPTFESENMKDGSDLISDWPMLNGLLNCAALCDLIAIRPTTPWAKRSIPVLP
jgi:urocanate hydratase